ncbi:MAG: acyl-CoA thioesterase [Holophagaceae bacterium]
MLISREMVLDQNIGLNETLFGGEMMSRMDKVAGITSALVSHNRVFVTVKVSELIFHSPVRAGDIIEFYATIPKAGNTSVTVQIEVKVYNPVSNARKDVTSGEFVMVAVDNSLHPEPILWKEDMLRKAKEEHDARVGETAAPKAPGKRRKP